MRILFKQLISSRKVRIFLGLFMISAFLFVLNQTRSFLPQEVKAADPVTVTTASPPSGGSPTIGNSSERTLFETTNGELILFYHSGGTLAYRTSSDNGQTWSNPVTIKYVDGATAYSFNGYIDAENSVYFTYRPSRGAQINTVLFRKLTYSAGSWTLGSEITVETGSSGNVSIIKTPEDILWALYVYNGNEAVVRSSSNDGVTWSDRTILSGVQITNIAQVILVLYNNQPMAIYNSQNGTWNPYYRLFNGTSWGDEQCLDCAVNYNASGSISAVSLGNNIHFIGGRPTYGTLRHSVFSNGSWSSLTTVNASSLIDTFYPKLTTDGTNVWLLWSRYSGIAGNYDIYFKEYAGSSWDTQGTALTLTGLNNRYVSVPEFVSSGGRIPFIYTSGSSAPYAINFNAFNGGNDITPPSITMVSPSEGAAISGTTVTVSATSTDDVNVVGVQFKVDEDVLIGAEDTIPPYSITWNSGEVSNGIHEIIAVARDAAGNYATSSPVTVTINNEGIDTSAPSVSILSPVDNDTISNGSVVVSAASTDDVGVVGVQFIVNDTTFIGSEVTEAPYQVTWDTTNLSNAPYRLIAVARDAAGNYATSTIVTVGVDNSSSQGLTIPSSHPRLWWTSERLAQAQAWYASNTYTPGETEYIDRAFVSLITGNESYCHDAINWATSYTISQNELDAAASNHARWQGEDIILIYDWCHEYLSSEEQSTLLNRWNRYLEILRNKSYGDATMYQNNYNWGYTRNFFEWAIATWGENATSTLFLEEAISTRWEDNFFQHALTTGKGGLMQEGTEYGTHMLNYVTVPFMTSKNFGRDLFEETDFFKGSVYYLIYATTPSETVNIHNSNISTQLIFPFNDDENFVGSSQYHIGEASRFMSTVSHIWSDLPIGQYARKWIQDVSPSTPNFILAVDEGGISREYTDLPYDYYAPGIGYYYGRTNWSTTSTVFHLQMGTPTGAGHSHRDEGNWQLWRNGRWLSRETTGYSDTIIGYGGVNTGNDQTVGHNGILINGIGSPNGGKNGSAVVNRVQDMNDFAYASVDISDRYRNNLVDPNHPQYDNPAANHIEREYLYIRPLETMVIFDRVRSNAVGSTSAEDIVKTFLAHFEVNPTIEDGNNVSMTNGTETIRLTTLVPSVPSYNVVDEEGTYDVGQYRLEVETSGEEQSYFLHVIQTRGSGDVNLTSAVQDTGSAYEATITHPTLGSVVVTFEKGMTSSGGAIEIGGETYSFLDRVQGIEVTDEGPVWETLGEDVTPPVISSVATSTVSDTTASITWTTNESATSTVEYGTTTGYGSTSSSSILITSHSITLTGLDPETTYHFRVSSQDVSGNAITSGDYTFTTQAEPDTTAPTVTAFTIPSTATALEVSISSFAATDDVGVTGYLLTESSSIPPVSSPLWESSATSSYTFDSEGVKTLYAWARDASGNVSTSLNDSVTIAVPDITRPIITSFSLPEASSSLTIPISSFTATDNVGVTGYCLSQTNDLSSCVWQVSAPTEFLYSID